MRRRVLLGGAAGLLGAGLFGAGVLGAGAVGTGLVGDGPADGSAFQAGAGRARVRSAFTLGVASGDPTPDGVVLWTRLAPEPLASDGRGGMPDRPVPVRWQVAEGDRFDRVVAEGVEITHPETAHSVHVEVAGLRPGTDHVYRFRVDDEIGPVGRARTAPAPEAAVGRVSLAFASCQNREDGFYPAYAGMAAEDLDLVIFLGDYIYEAGARDQLGRGHLPAGEITSLTDYRVRLAQYKTDPDLQAAHAAFPWAVTLDDHEVENNWTDTGSQPDGEPDQDPRVFRRRRAEAFQAYYEHMPLRRAQRPRGPDAVLHRRLRFGGLLDLYLLDTRQHRGALDPAARDDPAARLAPGRTVLGPDQEAWLHDGIASSTARWNVLAQQVFFSPLRTASGVDPDSWEGYASARDRLRDHLVAARTRNPMVLTGDAHANYVSDVKADFDDPNSATVATELVGTSISTGGNGAERNPGDADDLARNPHLRFVDHHRGYVRNVVTPGQWTADFRVVDDVTRRGTAVRTGASFVVRDGRPGAVPADPLS